MAEEVKPTAIDIEKVEKIVSRMKKKYEEQGLTFEEATGELKEIRTAMLGEKRKIEVQRIEELKEFESPVISKLGDLFLKLKTLMKPFYQLFSKFPQTQELSYYLESANMKFSARQWLALTTIIAVIAFALSLFLTLSGVIALRLNIFMAIFISLLMLFLTAFIVLLIPKRNAMIRGDNISRELPFVLRHIATELKSGIGLFRAIQIIASEDYGPVSEEFNKMVIEIEEGLDVKDALRNLSIRTQSKPLSMAANHMIRALKTGGNLSDAMNQIAENVSFELRNKMREFTQKLNFFGVIFIFVGIVLPVLVGILGSIKVTPLQAQALQMLPLNVLTLTLFFVVLMPLILSFFLAYVLVTQPKT